jgi:hypothetical protein
VTAALALELAFAPAVGAQTVWTGFDVSFSKALFADPLLPENQDRITDNVWITRGVNRGLYNVRVEMGYVDNFSPEDTEWATALIAANAGEEIAASNWADLTYTDWVTAYGGMGAGTLPANLLANNAVVHLITDNVYLDLRFTGWSGGGGSFSYDRAMGTITPPATTGDYNENGLVDAADYVLWRSTLNEMVTTPGDGADGDLSGTIDQGDYDFWRMNFGEVVPASAGGQFSAVPEPTPAAGVLIGLFGFRLWSGRQRRSFVDASLIGPVQHFLNGVPQ